MPGVERDRSKILGELQVNIQTVLTSRYLEIRVATLARLDEDLTTIGARTFFDEAQRFMMLERVDTTVWAEAFSRFHQQERLHADSARKLAIVTALRTAADPQQRGVGAAFEEVKQELTVHGAWQLSFIDVPHVMTVKDDWYLKLCPPEESMHLRDVVGRRGGSAGGPGAKVVFQHQ